MTTEFLEQLRQAAEAKEREEVGYRRDSRRRLEALEAERTRLFRRYNFLKDMTAAAATQAEAATGISAQLALAAAETGWSEARTGYEEMRERLRPVAVAIHETAHPTAATDGEPPAPADVVAAFTEFETWYREKFSQDFLDLLGRAAPTFQPLVDF
jgi:hypothetical protein